MDLIAEFSEWGYIGMFISAFIAGSIFPFCSEAVLALLIAAGYNPAATITVATAGNFLGGVTCYYIGRLGKIEWIEKYLGVKPDKLEKTKRFLQKGPGGIMAFFTFLPAGDAIIIALGYMRANMLICNLSMLLGKFLRYYLIYIGVDLFI